MIPLCVVACIFLLLSSPFLLFDWYPTRIILRNVPTATAAVAALCSRLLEQGQKVRHVAATNMNERSSRSHSCFTIKIEQKLVERNGDKEKTTTLTAKINLVDLAGAFNCRRCIAWLPPASTVAEVDIALL